MPLLDYSFLAALGGQQIQAALDHAYCVKCSDQVWPNYCRQCDQHFTDGHCGTCADATPHLGHRP